jgi:predicted amidohydrolase
MQAAAELRLWTVVGSVHLADSPRPTNCVYVISPSGALVDRYDERMLSPTKARLMYERGSRAVVFQAGGLTFGVLSGMETQYPELVSEYEAAGVDCVLFSTAGNPQQPGLFAVEATGLAAANSLWISYAGGVGDEHHPSGMIAPDGQWAALSGASGVSEVALTTVGATAGDGSRAWRRHARSERVG